MRCPHCRHDKHEVKDSRPHEEWIRRRRACLECDFRWTTYESQIPIGCGFKLDETLHLMEDYESLDIKDREAVRRVIAAMLITGNVERFTKQRIA